MTALRDASELLWPSVRQTIAELGLLGSDSAAAKLAQRYAQVIDATPDPKQANVLRWLGPELLKALVELGATPQARKVLEKGQTGPEKPESGLTRLRSAK